jgi:hypothetical protein
MLPLRKWQSFKCRSDAVVENSIQLCPGGLVFEL